MIPLIIRNTIANRQQIDDHFYFYKERFCQLQEENQLNMKSVDIVLAGKCIELRFETEKLFDSFIPSLRWAMECRKNTEVCSNEKTIFYIWQDSISNYFPSDIEACNIWEHRSEHASISIRPVDSHMIAYDYDNKEGYFCIEPSEKIELAHTAHPFLSLFHSWALENSLLFVHSAGIEIEGVGILISGLGGRGKSTTAVSALLNHCGFIGDDYVLLDSSDEKKGYPIYSSAFLNTDMLNYMEELKDCIIDVDHTRNNKTLVDLMVVKDCLKKEITFDLILLPNIIDSELLSIEKVPPATAMAEMVFSTANQNGERTNKVFMQEMFSVVKGLPVYQFNMGSDPHRNIEYLKSFTNEWRKKNV